MKYTFALVLIFFSFSVASAASKGTKKISSPWEKQQNIDKSRWTLAEWMAQKDKMKLQDMWLAMNTSANDFEFYLGGDTAAYKSKATTASDDGPSYRVNRLIFAAYATIVGLEFQNYEMSDVSSRGWNGIFNLRILGRSIQSTHLTLQYGLRHRTQPFSDGVLKETFQNQFAGASLSLYLTKYFGIEGCYQKIFKTKSDQDSELQGSRTEAGVFIDYNFFRVYGLWFREPITTTLANLTETEVSDQGILTGIRFFF